MPDKIEKNWTIKKRKTILMPNGKGRGVNGRNFGVNTVKSEWAMILAAPLAQILLSSVIPWKLVDKTWASDKKMIANCP
jgi:hypothetical protein